VLAARDAIKDNERVSNCGRRFWELTGVFFAARRVAARWLPTT
jgi:hypothetical protein